MAEHLRRVPSSDPALARYPAALAELFSLGAAKKDADYRLPAERLKEYVPDLVRMVRDEDLNERDQDDAAVWAPYHALKVLGVLGPIEAAGPLTACLDTDDDWIRDELSAVYAAIGPAAIPILQAYLTDREQDHEARGVASNALMAIAQAHPAVRAEIIAFLVAFLDRSTADANHDEEMVTTFVIADLAELKAMSAYETIRLAYVEDRVDGQVISLEDVERAFGMRPPVDFSSPSKPRESSGVRLILKCKVCEREREHIFRRVYYEMGTREDDDARNRYDPLIIPQQVVCPKCGAVDQYELGTMGHIRVAASLMARRFPGMGTALRDDQQVTLITFTTRWGPMHPLEAIERYQNELARQPEDAALHTGLGNLYRFLGRHGQAEAEYSQALHFDAVAVEAWIGLAQLAGVRGDIPEAIRCWEHVKDSAPRGALPPADRLAVLKSAEEALADLHQGILPPPAPEHPGASLATPPAARPTREPGQRKVGRNEPCPCGSGRKYKHCHGRHGRR
jgi:tetratricopeptide (TPR) repeat protein